MLVRAEVGGKYRNIEKCRAIAAQAVEELRSGKDLETVRSMVVAWK